MKKEKPKILRVTLTQDYYIKMIDKKMTEINGWSLDEVIRDWFQETDINMSHATRDGHRIGNGNKVLDISVMDIDDWQR
jgi:hypothetical protein